MNLSWRGFYAILDVSVAGTRDLHALARQLLLARPVALQLRAKQLAARDLLELAREISEICREHNTPFVVNDRAEIAALSGAWGVHLGQEDLPVQEIRRVFPHLHIGLSTHSLSQVHEAVLQQVDYLGFGPVFATQSKERPDPTVGPALFGEALRAARGLPVVAIGGIRRSNLSQLVTEGAQVVTAIAEVLTAEDPTAAAREITTTLQTQQEEQ
jgi:thiamine-phosphate pyrophosphorylase